MSVLQAVLYSILQGITVFLPISSNAHLLLAEIPATGFLIGTPAAISDILEAQILA